MQFPVLLADAELAHQLDAAELELQKDPSAEPSDNIPTQAHSRPPKFKSSHLDDSGFFSLQVAAGCSCAHGL
jgi:hypothetical protein